MVVIMSGAEAHPYPIGPIRNYPDHRYINDQRESYAWHIEKARLLAIAQLATAQQAVKGYHEINTEGSSWQRDTFLATEAVYEIATKHTEKAQEALDNITCYYDGGPKPVPTSFGFELDK